MVNVDLLLAALSHPTRRAALRLLREQDELCLCELMASTGTGQSNMSRHMATLKEAGLVADRRDAQWVRYRLCPVVHADAAQVTAAVLGIDEDGTAAPSEKSAA